jgi:Bacterial PH domain
MENMKNKPRISKWIGRGYLLLTILIACLYVVIAVWTPIYSSLTAGILFTVVMAFALALLGITTFSFYKTVYIIKDGFLFAWSPFAIINLKIDDITKIEQTRVPFYFRGIGASFYSGRFYIAGVGWTKAVITNLTDGVLITDKNGKNYLITPSNPDRFIKL